MPPTTWELNVGGAYNTVTAVDKSAVTWVLMAAEPDRLTPHTWYFPIVGSVPYKGYFKKASAQAAAATIGGRRARHLHSSGGGVLQPGLLR